MHTHAQKPQQSSARVAESQQGVKPTLRSLSLNRSAQLQHTLGNQALQAMLKSKSPDSISIQAKPTADKTSDSYEQEADSVAEQVVHAQEPKLEPSCACGGTCPQCQNHQKPLQMKRVEHSSGIEAYAPPIVQEVLQSSGKPLDVNTRNFMESRFGYDFGAVRIHDDPKAAKTAEEVSARAYTVGHHITMNNSQYSPQTREGRKLLAHELTHVVQQAGSPKSVQRQAEGAAKPSKNFPFSVKMSGCNGSAQSDFKEDKVRDAARRAFETARDGNADGPCIKNESLREDILSRYDGLEIVCKEDKPLDKCAEATGTFSDTLDIYRTVFDSSYCPGLEVSIFHEVVHFTQSKFSPHGNLSWDCQDSCYPDSDKHKPKRGNASGCKFETGRLPLFGVSLGKAYPGRALPTKGPAATYLRFYAGYDKRRYIASFIDLSYGVAVSFIGESETGEPREVSPSTTAFLATAALRFDPDKMGGLYGSVSGGLGISKIRSEAEFTQEAVISGGIRWKMFDLSVNAGLTFEPVHDKSFTLAATLTIGPKVRP